ncbi:MAG: ATP synthase F1 subunit delta [Bryobacteraceae bacterium]
MVSVVASRYARALADVIFSPGSGVDAGAALAQLRAVEAMLQESHELRIILLSPAVPPSKKRAVVAHLAGPAGLSKPVQNFLFVLIDRRRIASLSAIREAFETMLDQHLGVVRADVSSAAALGDAQRASLQTQLSRMSGKQARLEFSVDPKLLGGVVARIGSTVYDGSVRGELDALGKRLAG